jgi:hypothetical protein
MFQALISPITSLAGTWLEGKVSKAKAETEVKVARAKAEAKVYETEATSSMLNEQSLTSQMGESWKDEFWSLIFGAILICCFLPWTQPYVKEGFVFLQESTPNWFSNMLYTSHSYGTYICRWNRTLELRTTFNRCYRLVYSRNIMA